jgi:altronate hydrolase
VSLGWTHGRDGRKVLRYAQDMKVLVISDRDNVAVALEPLASGQCVDAAGRQVVTRAEIPTGHKVALADVAAGQPVIKYGSPIGLATAPIAAGDHVHTHNLASTRGRGDLA